MGAIGRVQARGQVTLPREIREATGIEAGAELVFLPLGPGRFEARLVPARRPVRDLIATYASDADAPTSQAIETAIEAGLVEESIIRQQRRAPRGPVDG